MLISASAEANTSFGFVGIIIALTYMVPIVILLIVLYNAIKTSLAKVRLKQTEREQIILSTDTQEFINKCRAIYSLNKNKKRYCSIHSGLSNQGPLTFRFYFDKPSDQYKCLNYIADYIAEKGQGNLSEEKERTYAEKCAKLLFKVPYEEYQNVMRIIGEKDNSVLYLNYYHNMCQYSIDVPEHIQGKILDRIIRIIKYSSL